MLAFLVLALLGRTFGDPGGGFATIREEDVEAHARALAAAPLEGRDSPSPGLARAGDYIIERLRQAGYQGAGPEGAFRLPWTRTLPAPVESKSALSLTDAAGETHAFAFGQDFVPLVDCNGAGAGEPVFCGFGIQARKEKYDDLHGVDLEGRVAVILSGEPRHKKRFEGPEISPEADVHVKLKNLAAAGVAGVVIVRRDDPDQPQDLPPPALAFRHTWAAWNPTANVRDPQIERSFELAVVEVTPAVASRIVGSDVLDLARAIDASGKPNSGKPVAAKVSLASATESRPLPIDNIAGVLPGSDPELRGEYVVVGAHYDHIGVGVRGQVGYGADDNGSGTAALLEVAEALAAATPRRSILVCAFSGEEDGLLGSQAFVRDPPVALDAMVAMLNLDMVGRGETDEVVVLGTERSADLAAVLKRAERQPESARIKALTGKAEHLWQRSDHYNFFQAGVPVLFFFESESELDNPDYHTFRDTLDLLNLDKIARTARLTFNAAWILSEDDERPSRPGG
jgi:hypothetical protein